MATAALCFYRFTVKLLPYSILLVGCCIVACKNKKPINLSGNTETPAQHIFDSLKSAKDIDSADYNLLFKNKTNIWLYKMLLNKQNKWSNFKLIDYWHKDSLTQYSYKPDSEFYKEYAIFLEWSPDSAYILDYGSYGVEMMKDARGEWHPQGADADLEVSLIDQKSKTKSRLLFFGTGAGINAVHWIDSNKVALFGWDNAITNKTPDTMIWLINIKDRMFRKYKYQVER